MKFWWWLTLTFLKCHLHQIQYLCFHFPCFMEQYHEFIIHRNTIMNTQLPGSLSMYRFVLSFNADELHPHSDLIVRGRNAALQAILYHSHFLNNFTPTWVDIIAQPRVLRLINKTCPKQNRRNKYLYSNLITTINYFQYILNVYIAISAMQAYQQWNNPKIKRINRFSNSMKECVSAASASPFYNLLWIIMNCNL